METPAYLAEVQRLDLDAVAADSTMPAADDALMTLLASPNIASKRWAYRQYDHMVQTNTVNLPGFGAGVVRIKGTDRALAMSVDGNGRYCYLDPRRGAMLAVAEAARNVACAGARPLGATNCLNFGNPERPAIMWQFAQAVEGIGEACRALGVPITGGNVSLYNETDGQAIYPTPVIGVVGLLEHADRVLDAAVPGLRRRRSCCSARAAASSAAASISRRCTVWCAACRRRSISTPSGRCRICWSSWPPSA